VAAVSLKKKKKKKKKKGKGAGRGKRGPHVLNFVGSAELKKKKK
jgi:hypothetical protein